MNISVLTVDASMRFNGSQSRVLTGKIVEHISEIHTIKQVRRDLAQGIPHINEAWIDANFTPESQRTAQQRSVLALSDALVSELLHADVIVIGLPIYNFGAPAAFKAWIDLVCRAKLTFQYGENGPEGLLNGKKAIVAVASGGTQLGSDIDFVTAHTTHALGFIGIEDVTFVDASGMGRDKDEVWNRALQQISHLHF